MAREPALIGPDAVLALIPVLRSSGYRVIGPQVRDGALVLDELTSPDQLAVGWDATVEAGSYRLHRRDDGAFFAHSAGPQSWKSYLHPDGRRLWAGERTADGFRVEEEAEDERPLAFLGVRACDVAAIARLDRVLGGGRFPDTRYARRRARLLVIAVDCAEPAPTCFCASLQTGPGVTGGYDLKLTELVSGGRHTFVVTAGSDAGDDVLGQLPRRPASAADLREAARAVDAAALSMQRTLPTVGLRELLIERRDSPHWQDVADRCLTCGSCTMVCPTCFCSSVTDATDLSGDHASREQRWTSCFDIDFSYVHGGAVRTSPASRYRQWLTHKLSTWHDQFGSSGCVGCGRCIVWCPVGIDLTQEVGALRREASRHDAAV